MKNIEPLLWNTLDEAAAWLSQMRGETWTAKKVIDAALRVHQQDARHPKTTLISAVLPHGCAYGVYVWDAAKGSPSNPFVPKFPGAIPATAPIPLWQAGLGDILLRGKTEVSLLPDRESRIEGEYHFIKPFGTSVEVTMDMLGISGRELEQLAKLLPDAKRTEVKMGPASAASWDAMIYEERKTAWGALTPVEKRTKARELVKKHNGNKSAAGREVGITGKRIAMLLIDDVEKGDMEPPLPTNSNSGPFGLPQPKHGKASR